MLDKYFNAPKTIKRLRSGPAGRYIDGFAATLKERGYAYATAVRYLRSASHLALVRAWPERLTRVHQRRNVGCISPPPASLQVPET